MKPSQFLFPLALAIVLSLGLAGCGDNSSVSNPPGTPPPGGGGSDPYADLGPYTGSGITDPTITTSGALSYSGEGDLMEINMAGFAAPVNRMAFAPSANPRASKVATVPLTKEDITVVEDGIIKGITVDKIDADTRAAADILFVVDTTGSMSDAIDSVKDSIVAFTDFLDAEGLDVRLAAVTVGDAYDTVDNPTAPARGTSLRDDTPPDFDSDERPTFPFSTDFAAFKSFIQGDSARGGNDTPENTLGALDFGSSQLVWRDGAQRIAVVITDVCSHNKTTFEDVYGSYADYAHWLPPVATDLIERLKGQVTVHVVAPKSACVGDIHTNMADLTGLEGTGGVFVNWDLTAFDLTSLPIAEATAGGYLLTFSGTRDGSLHTVRVLIDNGSGIRGEFTLEEKY